MPVVHVSDVTITKKRGNHTTNHLPLISIVRFLKVDQIIPRA